MNTGIYECEITEEIIAEATNEDGTERVVLSILSFDFGQEFKEVAGMLLRTPKGPSWNGTDFFMLNHHLMDWDDECWTRMYNTPKEACDAFEAEAGRTYAGTESGDARFHRVYEEPVRTYAYKELKVRADRR